MTGRTWIITAVPTTVSGAHWAAGAPFSFSADEVPIIACATNSRPTNIPAAARSVGVDALLSEDLATCRTMVESAS